MLQYRMENKVFYLFILFIPVAIFRITGGFRNDFDVIGGFLKAGTSFLKRVLGIFLILFCDFKQAETVFLNFPTKRTKKL
jgi:hypothetical protein